MSPEQTPASLAQLLRRKSGRAPEREPDKLGQFGLLFTEPEPEPQTPVPDTWEEPTKPTERKLWTVAELVSTLRGKVERAYADVWVEGEISNCRPASSGHLYFTLKDGDAQLLTVLFRRQVALLKFKPADGMSVLVRGRVSVFESRGQLQLIAETLEPRGAGALQLAFEQLKQKLRSEGLFEADRKRPLPAFPQTIGVITSTQGAVLRDIATVVRRRHANLNILVFPAAMQGPSCAADVLRGLRYFNTTQRHPVDLIVIARGGGSAEDLAGFNDEALARAIAASDLPVVSAVGHETDFTIADFVADLRAPTPSAAAELVTAAQHRVEERVQSLYARLLRAMRFQGMQARQRFTHVAASAAFARMRDALGRRQQRVDERRFRLESSMTSTLGAQTNRLKNLTDRLQRQDIRRTLHLAQRRNDRLRDRLDRIGHTLLQQPNQRLAAAGTRLQALSPLAVLDRGYALVFNAEGKLLRSTASTTEGETITTRLAQGQLTSRILKTDHSS
jgi:exodeoxyribonuclease VII large subunit